MLSPAGRAFGASLISCVPFLASAHAQAQQQPSAPPPAPLEVTVTADRIPTSVQRTGSALTIIRREEIERSNPASLVDALRAVPGLFLTEAGGPGSTSDIRLRGANPNQTLVLIDGVRVNDPAAASGEFDGSLIAPSLIDRIEVLRGPQSALYGSDAIGGVVNIITRRGRGQPSFSLGLEGGSHGTVNAVGSAAGAIGPWSFAASGTAQRSDGFSRYGHRIGRLAAANNIAGVPGGRLEDDGFSRLGGYARLGYNASQGFRFDLFGLMVDMRSDLDAGSGLATPSATTFADTPNLATRRFGQIGARLELDGLDGAITHAAEISVSRTDRSFDSITLGRVAGQLRATRGDTTRFVGDRYAAEYQLTARLGQFGTAIGGARLERETADTFRTDRLPIARPELRTLGAGQDTASLFGLWQAPIGERLLVSLGARHDKVSGSAGVTTWRATAAYRIRETGTTLRASLGTGAKAPTLFQRFSSIGTPDLNPERSFGFDAGIDQAFWDGRALISLTAFSNSFRNLIAFDSTAACLAQTGTRCYVNIDRAATAGLEASLRLDLVPSALSAQASYTYLHAKDEATNLALARRPQHVGRIGLSWTPTPQWSVEPSVTFVSERFSQSGERQRLAPFARFDARIAYQVNENWRAHVRIENITDARYQDVYNFGTTGRAVYAGLNATW